MFMQRLRLTGPDTEKLCVLLRCEGPAVRGRLLSPAGSQRTRYQGRVPRQAPGRPNPDRQLHRRQPRVTNSSYTKDHSYKSSVII